MQAEGRVGGWAGEWAGRLPVGQGGPWPGPARCSGMLLQQTCSAQERNSSPTPVRVSVITAAHRWPFPLSQDCRASSYCPVCLPWRSLFYVLFPGKSLKAFVL